MPVYLFYTDTTKCKKLWEIIKELKKIVIIYFFFFYLKKISELFENWKNVDIYKKKKRRKKLPFKKKKRKLELRKMKLYWFFNEKSVNYGHGIWV